MARRKVPVVVVVLLTLAAVAVGFLASPLVPSFELELGDLVIRTQQGHHHAFPSTDTGQPAPTRPPLERGRIPRGVVLVIGDGMGLGQVSAGSYLRHGAGGGLFLETAPVTGLVRTASADRLVTDSAAAASAMATGFKVNYRTLSIRPDGSRPTTLFEAAHAAGLAVGAVTTAALVDATPAAFLAHVPSRYDYGEILTQLLASEADVLIGGIGTGDARIRHNTVYNELVAGLVQASPRFTVARTSAELQSAHSPLLALLPGRPRDADQYGPPLVETGIEAYDRLVDDAEGFILLVECEATDSHGHGNDIAAVVAAVGELDDAARALVERAEEAGDVLVIATADHDTGSLAVVDDDGSTAEVRWASTEHTAQLVALFAWGAGAEHFEGVLDNTEIATRIAALLGLAGLPAPVAELTSGSHSAKLADSGSD